MSDKPNALRLADVLQSGADDPMWAHHCEMSKGTCDAAAAELRRLHDENEMLRDELAEQARLNGMGSEREARLMAVNTDLLEALYTAEALLLSMGMKSSDAYQQIDAAITAALNEPVKARRSSGKRNLNVSTTTGSSPT